MDISKAVTQKSVALTAQEEAPDVVSRLGYLRPSRYFQQYMFFDREIRQTCWLPEGFMQ